MDLSTQAQEFDSDLYPTTTSNTLLKFLKSDKRKMTVTTYRNSDKHGLVEELETKYKKGIIFSDRITFNTKYSEHYIVEDRKRSLGKYDFVDGKIKKYERTDYNNDNAMMYTYYHLFRYENNIIKRELIRTKEYGPGSVEMDTTSYIDTNLFEIKSIENGYKQNNLKEDNNVITYTLDDNVLEQKTNQVGDFKEIITYTYDSKGHLIRIERKITNKDGKKLNSKSELRYNIDGLLSEVLFYDEQGDLLEKKVITYK